jgi:hypothetical protein
MRRACVKHGPFVGLGSVLVPERFRDHCRLIAAGRSGFSWGEKHEKLLAFDLYQLRNRSHVTESVL